MRELKVFENSEFGQARVVTKDNEPWFVGKDVCGVLEISKHRDAFSRLPSFMRESLVVDTLGGRQEMKGTDIISTPGGTVE